MPTLLPNLSTLRVRNNNSDRIAIGVQLRGVTRPNGRVERGEDLAESRPVYIPGIMHTPGGLYQSGKARLEDIASKVDAGSGSPLARRWLDAMAASMQHKVELYTRDGEQLTAEIVDQHRKLNEFVRQARQPIERVDDPRAVDPGGTHPRPPAGSPPEDSALAQWHQTEKWDLVKEANVDRWTALVAQKAAFLEIAAEARARKDKTTVTVDTNALRREVAASIRELAAYETQTVLLDSMADLVEAFINAPLVAQNSFVNFILAGAAGVGKTRLAGAIAKLLCQLGMYVYQDVVECSRSDLVAEFVGQTAPKTRAFLLRSLEKIVFLDEAYALTTWSERSDGLGRALDAYSGEAVAELVAHLSRYVGRSCLIAAGYEAQMMRDFLPANEGLSRRFSYVVSMQQYQPEYLVSIFIEALATALSTDAAAVTSSTARNFFTLPALVFLEDVLTDGRKERADHRPAYPLLHQLFAPQAGAMVNLANVAALLIASSQAGLARVGLSASNDSWAVGFLDMHDILITQLQQRLPAAPMGWQAASQELAQIGADNGWIRQGQWTASDAARERVAADTSRERGDTASETSETSHNYTLRKRSQPSSPAQIGTQTT